MIVYKTIPQYDSRTGKRVGVQRIHDHYICDFTGEKVDIRSEPIEYKIDYGYNDPSFGDGEGESWMFDYSDHDNCYDIFSQDQYIFKTREDGTNVFPELLEKASKELKVQSLLHLLRWSRGKMLEKVIKAGKYDIDDFLSD